MNVVSRSRLVTRKFEIFPVALTFFFERKGTNLYRGWWSLRRLDCGMCESSPPTPCPASEGETSDVLVNKVH